MDSIYRTLCFCQKIGDVYKVFYGHAIYWKLTSLDYVIKGWKRKNVQGDIYVFFTDLSNCDAITQFLDEKKVEVEANSKKHSLHFDWEQNEAAFIPNDSRGGENDYKPFISLCSNASYYFSDVENEFIDSFLREKKEVIARLEEEYFVPLVENTHLLNTFTVYTPVRIETSLKNIRDESNILTGFEFHINDVFNDYQECVANFLLSSDGKKKEGDFILSEEPKNITAEFDPDYMELTIKDGEDVIFEEKAYFLKSIRVDVRVESGSIKTSGGTVATHSSSSFIVGGDND